VLSLGLAQLTSADSRSIGVLGPSVIGGADLSLRRQAYPSQTGSRNDFNTAANVQRVILKMGKRLWSLTGLCKSVFSFHDEFQGVAARTAPSWNLPRVTKFGGDVLRPWLPVLDIPPRGLHPSRDDSGPCHSVAIHLMHCFLEYSNFWTITVRSKFSWDFSVFPSLSDKLRQANRALDECWSVAPMYSKQASLTWLSRLGVKVSRERCRDQIV